MQFDFAYTLGKSEDNAPITSVLSVQGDAGRTNPDDLDFDRGPTCSTSATPSSAASSRRRDHRRRQRARRAASSTAPSSAWRCSSPAACRSTCAPTRARSTTTASPATGRPASTRNSLQPAGALQRRPAAVAAGAGRRLAQGRGDRRGEEPVQHRAVERRVERRRRGRGRPPACRSAPLPTSGDQLTPNGGYEQRQLQIGFRFVF